MTPINLKLINLLNSFSQNEIKEFKKFISSGLYTTGRNYLPLLNHLIRNKSKGLDKIYAQDIYLKLYPDKKFSNQTLKNRFSELYKLGEEFLIHLCLKEDKFEKEKILLKMLIEKKLYDPFENKYKKIFHSLDSEKYDDKKFENLLFMQNIHMDFLKEKSKAPALYISYHQNSHFKLCIYLISLFEIGIEFSLQDYDNRKYEYNFVTDFLKKLDINDLIKNFCKSDQFIFKVTVMNYYLYKAFEDSTKEEYYLRSHKMFGELSEYLSENYRILMFNQMSYFCMRKQHEGIKKFQYELFNLYNEKLIQGLFADLQNKIYLSNNFRDYVVIGIALKKYKWVEDFIKKYSKELPQEFREDEVKLSFAKLNIAHGNYEKSLLNLDNIKTNNYLLYIDCSVLRLCCYYELSDFEEAYMELDKLKHYLRNHKEVPSLHSSGTSNFIKIYQKLLNSVTDPSREEIGFLIKELNTYKNYSKKDWVLEKISELNI